jgi:hypothetical protein
MEIHRHNNKWPANPGRILSYPDLTRDFTVLRAGTEVGVKLQAKSLNHTFTVELSPEETEALIRNLLKKS